MPARLKSGAALPPLSLAFFSLAAPLHAQEAPQAALAPVVVTATRQATRESDLLADVTVIDREEIERSGGESIVDLLARQTGIQMARSGGPGTQSSFFVRGANSDQVKVLVDGLPIGNAEDLVAGSALGDIPLADVERIEILRGPASTLYGADAIGGVIQVFTRKGARQGVQADAFVGYGTQNTFQSNVGVSGGGEKWNFRVAGNTQSTDAISALRNAQNQDRDRDGYRNTGGSAAFSLLPAEGHELGLSYRENSGRSHYDNGSGPYSDDTFDNRIDFRSEQWQMFSKNRIASFWDSTLRYGQTSDHRVDYSPYSPTGSVFDSENRLLGWQNDFTVPLGKLLLAFEHLEQSAGPAANYAGGDNVHNNSLQVGWTGDWGRHHWQVNAREDDHSTFGGKATYSLAYGYQIASNWRARASYGTAFKAPSLSQLYGIGGNAALRPEESRNRELGLVWQQGSQTASATYYLNSVGNLITWVDDATLAPYYGQLENVAHARMEGVTLAYSARLGAWGVRTSYDWLQATNEDNGTLLARRARNKAQLAVTYDWGPLKAGAEQVLVGSRQDPYAETGKLGGYGLTNLTLSYAVSKDLSIEGRLDNLFDKSYALAQLSPTQAYGTLGITAFVGIRYAPR